MFDSGRATWWPRRLIKDCRTLLEEVGLAAGSTPRSRTPAALASVAATDSGVDQDPVLQTGLDVEPAPESAIEEVLAGSEWDPLTHLAREPEVPPDLQAIAARREELLVEGRRRWQAYVSRSQLSEH